MKSHQSLYFTITHPHQANTQKIIILANYLDAAIDTFHNMHLVDKAIAAPFFKEHGHPRVVIFDRESDERGKLPWIHD